MPAAAYAQSTGTVEAEEQAIVITGTRAQRRRRRPDARHDQGQGRPHPGDHLAPATPARPSSTPSTWSRASASRTTTPTASSGGNVTHPRLRFDPHQPDLRRHPAQRQRQLRDLLEPAARPRADRAGQRQPRLDRRRLADRLGGRRHRQLPHHDPDQGLRRPRRRLGSATGTIWRAVRHGQHRRIRPVGHAGLVRRQRDQERQCRSTITARSTSSSITARSTSRSAPTATSSRSPATTTRTATTSSVRCRCART